MFKTTRAAIIVLGLCEAASASRLVYMAEQSFPGLPELFLVDLDSPGTTTPLSRPYSAPAAGGAIYSGILNFDISPDGRSIVYIGDQDVPSSFRPYIVDITNPGTQTLLGNLPSTNSGGYAKFSPDGRYVALTFHDGSFKQQLSVISLASPGTATLMNGNLHDNGPGVSLTGFDITSDGRYLVYTAAELDRFVELYVVALDSPTQSVRLNAHGGSVGDSYEGRFHVLPESNKVVYSQVWENPGVREVHIVSIDDPGKPVTLNAPYQPDGYTENFFVSPDGKYVAYTADQVTDGFNEAFIVQIDEPGVAHNLSGSLSGGGRVVGFTSDSSNVLFLGGTANDLYFSPVDLSSDPILLAQRPAADDSMYFFSSSPDGDQVAYYLERSSGLATDVMVAHIAAPGLSSKINGPLPNGSLQFGGPVFSPDGSEVVFDATESQDDFRLELFFSSVSAPGTSTRLNDPGMAGYVASYKRGDYEFLPANASPTGQPGASNVTPTPATSATESTSTQAGGGATTWLILFLGFVLACPTSGGNRH